MKWIAILVLGAAACAAPESIPPVSPPRSPEPVLEAPVAEAAPSQAPAPPAAPVDDPEAVAGAEAYRAGTARPKDGPGDRAYGAECAAQGAELAAAVERERATNLADDRALIEWRRSACARALADRPIRSDRVYVDARTGVLVAPTTVMRQEVALCPKDGAPPKHAVSEEERIELRRAAWCGAFQRASTLR